MKEKIFLGGNFLRGNESESLVESFRVKVRGKVKMLKGLVLLKFALENWENK